MLKFSGAAQRVRKLRRIRVKAPLAACCPHWLRLVARTGCGLFCLHWLRLVLPALVPSRFLRLRRRSASQPRYAGDACARSGAASAHTPQGSEQAPQSGIHETAMLPQAPGAHAPALRAIFVWRAKKL
jgi:hypothetical protein